jgi:hypothetical protein
MGLFSSIFGSKTKTKVNMPGYVEGPMKQYAGAVSGLMGQDPYSFVAPPSELQTLAYDKAKGLGGWQAPMNDALGAVKAAGAAPAASAGEASTAQYHSAGPASTATGIGYKAPVLGPAAQAGGVTIGDMQNIEGASLLDNFDAYHDPGLEHLVDASMADYNMQVAQQRAAEQARLAGAWAWGSGGQFYMSNLDAQNNLKGGLLDAQLRAQAYRDAMNASNMDAGRRQEAAGFNASAANNRTFQQSGLDQQRNLFNTDATNQFKLGQAGFDANASAFGANAKNQASMFNAGQQNDMSMFDAGQHNQVGMFNSGEQNDMSQYNAGLQNAQLDRSLQAAGMQGGIANMMAGNSRADVGLIGDLGAMQYGVNQAEAMAPLMHMGAISGMMDPLMATMGATKTGTPSLFNAGLGIASLFSDRRLKRDIKKVGKARGLNLYTYRYVDSDLLHLGVMAQEVAKKKPQALGPRVAGYMTVDYGAL